jgi:phosphopantothenoylcysteine decarboxylase/phosphopantothenate--cysteine ligase|tara:strand:+ start:6144 stop:7349 length:1206 start_codon:yes stop_codon:yes gene_type:complete
MNNFFGKKILLVICGGISAYKSLEIIRSLKKRGYLVKTILTKSAKEFVTPLSVVSLSQEKVYDDLFSLENEAEMDHISLSRWSDLILVAPATANTISKLSVGSSDDLASTVILASNKDVFLVPAMNVRMWEHPSTKENLNKLKDFGYKIIGPEIGDMACGEFGEGKMTEPDHIIQKIENYLINLSKSKKFKALVTAGPTREFIDPVRFITNKSSGKQGFELAKSLSNKGFETTLISGPTNLKIDKDINFIKVETADQMFKATQDNLPADVAILAASVSDFKVKNPEEKKIKKEYFTNLNLERNIDILNYVSNHNSLRPKLVIGFAAETHDIKKNAKKKLTEKNCDWIIANDVSDKSIGFESDFNEVTIFYKNRKVNEEKLFMKKKSDISDEIINRVVSQLN